MPLKEAQVNVRLPEELDRWLEVQAGGKRRKQAYIRRLLEREKAREEEDDEGRERRPPRRPRRRALSSFRGSRSAHGFSAHSHRE